MALVWVNLTQGSKLPSGERQFTVSRSTGQTSDVSVCIDNAVVKTKGDLLHACKLAADHLLSDTLK